MQWSYILLYTYVLQKMKIFLNELYSSVQYFFFVKVFGSVRIFGTFIKTYCGVWLINAFRGGATFR